MPLPTTVQPQLATAPNAPWSRKSSSPEITTAKSRSSGEELKPSPLIASAIGFGAGALPRTLSTSIFIGNGCKGASRAAATVTKLSPSNPGQYGLAYDRTFSRLRIPDAFARLSLPLGSALIWTFLVHLWER
jgi:hypothetical protein